MAKNLLEAKLEADKAQKQKTSVRSPLTNKEIERMKRFLESDEVGKSDSVNIAIDILRKGGKAILIGNVSPEIDFPLQKVVTHELKILGSCAIRGEYEVVLSLLETGKISVDDQISAVVPLSEGAVWFYRLYRKEEDFNKVILVP